MREDIDPTVSANGVDGFLGLPAEQVSSPLPKHPMFVSERLVWRAPPLDDPIDEGPQCRKIGGCRALQRGLEFLWHSRQCRGDSTLPNVDRSGPTLRENSGHDAAHLRRRPSRACSASM